MRIKSIVFFVLRFLQMLPWIVEIVFGAVNTSPLLWVLAACISTWAIIKITRWTNRKKLAKIRFDLGGWKKRTVLYSSYLG
ncbi:hypothetical protein [Bacillus sp. S/N-304-OC-R1]|uniref:hypothetical protein n=1 Tax=Bacillus sp. S/N-304-OC-R1 TaxID=2758034 RepID=UPI001C8D3BC6|nr:hypothetical protein [Bacillus sp. S/N-304-OC-R1]MBY0121609.1 hypothetical protein [Bacillus sp. S/N-304-OC-R1]